MTFGSSWSKSSLASAVSTNPTRCQLVSGLLAAGVDQTELLTVLVFIVVSHVLTEPYRTTESSPATCPGAEAGHMARLVRRWYSSRNELP